VSEASWWRGGIEREGRGREGKGGVRCGFEDLRI